MGVRCMNLGCRRPPLELWSIRVPVIVPITGCHPRCVQYWEGGEAERAETRTTACPHRAEQEGQVPLPVYRPLSPIHHAMD